MTTSKVEITSPSVVSPVPTPVPTPVPSPHPSIPDSLISLTDIDVYGTDLKEEKKKKFLRRKIENSGEVTKEPPEPLPSPPLFCVWGKGEDIVWGQNLIKKSFILIYKKTKFILIHFNFKTKNFDPVFGCRIRAENRAAKEVRLC